MPFGLSGVSMGRLSSQSERYQEKRRQQESQQQQQNQHRPTQSVDQVTRVSRLALLKDAASATFKPSKSLSWLPSLMRKAVHPPVMIRSAQELHRVLAPVPPIPAAAASSSMKSDPSSVRDEYRSSGRWLANKPSAAPSVGGLPESDESGQPHQRWLRAERSLYESSISDGSDGLSFRSVSPASAATSISMADQKMQRRAGQQFDEEVSANVLELIQETEQAFEAVGNAINDASSVSRLPDSLHLAAPSPNVPRHHSQGPSAPSAERLQPVPPPPKAAEPKLSAKKSGNAIRRAMMEGVGSKLLGQRFKRIVADEMLTPARIEELKKKREQAEAEEEAKLQLACDVSNNEQIDMTDTPEEPFHLERFVTHDDAPAVESPPKSSEVNDRHLNAVTDVETTHLAPPQQGGSSQASAEYTAMTDDMPLDNTSFLMAPSRSPTPGRLTPEPRRLSTIPEIIVDSSPRQSLQESAVATTRHQQRRNSDDDFIYLNGTDISFTNRSFRHGPIACHRPEPTKRDAELEVDESVDWTAFHMAIMGGAGDLASGLYEDEQEDMAEEMAEWFDEFGFETHGQLIPSCDDSSRSSSQSDTSSSPSTVDLDADLPIPVHMEQPNLYHAHSRSDGSIDPTAGPFDAIRFFRSSSLKRWRAMEEPAYWAPSIRRNSGRKPMKRPDPLVVGNEDYGYGDVSETVADMAPMSCNLESDLGDYLRWGSQHVGDSM